MLFCLSYDDKILKYLVRLVFWGVGRGRGNKQYLILGPANVRDSHGELSLRHRTEPATAGLRSLFLSFLRNA